MKKIFLLSLLLFCLTSWSQTSQPLPAEQVFTFTADANKPHTISMHWQMAPGYYLYKERFQFKPKRPFNLQLGQPIFPQGLAKVDKDLGNFEIYQNNVDIDVPVLKPDSGRISVVVTYQGCSEAGFCYPPITKLVTLKIAAGPMPVTDAEPVNITNAEELNPQERALALLAHHNLWLILVSFFGFGILLAFTPCVLPMIPILSSIILGHGKQLTTRKAFFLSLVYVLSMSLTYAAAGILVGHIGGSIQALLQKPWIIILFSVIFILLAISLFGFYNIQPPQKLEAALAKISSHQKKGSYLGVAVMGCLGTLIVSPCVTPPLIGALGYISQTGDAVLGGAALFATGLGMGLPLLLICTSGAKLLPKTGAWMVTIKVFLGVLLLGVAILMLSRILPGSITLMLWALLLISYGLYLSIKNNSKTGLRIVTRGIGIALLVYGIVLVIGAALGNTDPLKPFDSKHIQGIETFKTIKSLQDLTQQLALAKEQQKPVILDFYADWCLSCKEMDRNTWTDPQIKTMLNNFIVLRADVTANDATDKTLMQKYNVIAPPTVLFFTSDGSEITNSRVVGEVSAVQLLPYLQQVQMPKTSP